MIVTNVIADCLEQLNHSLAVRLRLKGAPSITDVNPEGRAGLFIYMISLFLKTDRPAHIDACEFSPAEKRS